MEPNVSSPTPPIERGGYRGIEATKPGEQSAPSKELEAPKETAPERAGSQPTPPPAPPQILPQAQPLPVPAPQPSTAAAASQVAIDDTPLVAADEDLIEKEWVDKAKKIVTETKSDPYAQEDKVSRLQADYIKKRYGKDITVSK